MVKAARGLRLAVQAAAWMLAAGSLRAEFGDGLSSAAAEGAGNAAVARADEAGALFVNPGALGRLDRGDMTLMYAKPLTGIPDVSVQQGVAAVAVPVGKSWTAAGGARYFDDAGLSREMEGALGLAVRAGRLSAGAAGVLLRRSYDVGSIPGASSDPVFANGSSKSGIGIDAGVHYQASDVLSLGAAGRNLNRPDMGLAGEDKAPMTWRAGAGYRMGAFTFFGEARGASGSTSADSKWGAGVEFRAMSNLVFRAGGDGKEVAAGMGLNFHDLRVDYAFSFLQSLGAGEAASHRMSFGYKFGPPRPSSTDASIKPARPAVKGSPKGAEKRPSRQKPSTQSRPSVSTSDKRAYPTPAAKSSGNRRVRPLD
jgi:hypothetical protein